MEIDENTKQAIQKVVRPLITSAVAFAAVGAVTAAVSKMLVTNVKESGLTGDKEMKPTDDDMTVSKVETAASETEGRRAGRQRQSRRNRSQSRDGRGDGGGNGRAGFAHQGGRVRHRSQSVENDMRVK